MGFRLRQARILVYVDLVQDIDILAPVLLALRARGEWRLSIRVARWLETASPRTAGFLRTNGFRFRYVRRAKVIAGAEPLLFGIAAILTASESSADAHAASHALVKRAAQSRIASFTLQHGLESLASPGVTFASDTIFAWGPAETMACPLSPDTRSRLVRVGRPAPLLWSDDQPLETYDVGVFENLHWDRYDDDERRQFLTCLLSLSQARPHLSIALRTHPAGGWLDQHEDVLSRQPNLTFTSSARARKDISSGADAVRRCVRVITTPSTVALDAAQAGKPTALALEGPETYQPLQILRTGDDWIDFADNGGASEAWRFAEKSVWRGDASVRICEYLASHMRA